MFSHPNYQRFATTHFIDMHCVEKASPEMSKLLKEVVYSVNKSGRRFSSILAAMNKITCHDLTAINFDNNHQKGIIERFISRIHHADCGTMDDARLQLLLRKGVALQKLPMTSHTLENRLRRSMYQSTIWTMDTVTKENIYFVPGYF